jgi:hypothetical protein
VFGFGVVMLGVGPRRLQLARRLHVSAGLAGQGAFITAEGVGVDVALAVRRSYWSVGLQSRLALDLAPEASGFIDAGCFVPLVERRFRTLMPERNVGNTALLAPQIGLGLALRL